MSGNSGTGRGWRDLAVNAGLSVVAILVSGLVLETGARLFEARRPPAPQVAEYIWDWDHKMPGGFYVMKSEAVGWPPWEEINGDGLRDRTRPHEKPDLVKRIAVLGDSVTLGDGIRPAEAYPQLLEQRFDDRGVPAEVMNVALWGWSTRQQRTAWQRIARRYRPDLAVLAVCLNDIPELHNNLSRPPRWLAWLHGRSAVVRLIVGAERKEIDRVEGLFATPAPRQVEEAMARFEDEVRHLRGEVQAEGSAFAMIVFPFRFQVEAGAPPPRVQSRLMSFCEREQIVCLDLLPALERLGATAFVDYDHLSAEGARRTADVLLESGVLAPPPAAEEVLRGASTAAVEATASQPSRSEDVPAAALLSHRGEVRLAAAWRLGRSRAASAARDLAGLLAADPSTAVRAAAARSLGRIGSRAALPALFDALGDPSEAVRFEAARGLTALGLTAADVPPLQAALASEDDFVCAFAAWNLGNLGEPARPAVPDLARALQRDRLDVVLTAALARIGPAAEAAVPALVTLVRHGDPGQRWRAARSLGRIGRPAVAAVPALVDALGDQESMVRAHAARALGRVQPADRALAAAALQRATGDPDEGVRREAREALGQLH